MKFDILTLFPEMFTILNQSILGKAIENNLIDINLTNIRDFSNNKHLKVDDYPYGGGNGMVMQCQPIYDSYMSITKDLDYKPRVIYMYPTGQKFRQTMAKQLSNEKHIIILCGHYEGIDQRVIDEIVTDEISIGDYILTGGEIPALVLVDAISRLIPGVLGNNNSYEEESFVNGLLEHPQYTRPEIWNNKVVPEILLSGNHQKIKQYNKKQSIIKTLKSRPDLINIDSFDAQDIEFIQDYLKKNTK